MIPNSANRSQLRSPCTIQHVETFTCLSLSPPCEWNFLLTSFRLTFVSLHIGLFWKSVPNSGVSGIRIRGGRVSPRLTPSSNHRRQNVLCDLERYLKIFSLRRKKIRLSYDLREMDLQAILLEIDTGNLRFIYAPMGIENGSIRSHSASFILNWKILVSLEYSLMMRSRSEIQT